MSEEKPTPISPAVILCGCGSGDPIRGACRVCLESVCASCAEDHEDGKCG